MILLKSTKRQEGHFLLNYTILKINQYTYIIFLFSLFSFLFPLIYLFIFIYPYPFSSLSFCLLFLLISPLPSAVSTRSPRGLRGDGGRGWTPSHAASTYTLITLHPHPCTHHTQHTALHPRTHSTPPYSYHPHSAHFTTSTYTLHTSILISSTHHTALHPHTHSHDHTHITHSHHVFTPPPERRTPPCVRACASVRCVRTPPPPPHHTHGRDHPLRGGRQTEQGVLLL